MRGLASTLALVVVLAGLGAYIYFVDSTRPAPTGVEGEPARTKVFEVENDKINEITITAKGETTLLRKAEGGWPIRPKPSASPRPSPASSASAWSAMRRRT
jgi:hypothetical protein